MKYNNKYRATIKDLNIDKLILGKKGISNEIFEDLANMNFKKLKELDLSVKKITDIKIQENVKFSNLVILNLGGNQIIDIKVSENAKFED